MARFGSSAISGIFDSRGLFPWIIDASDYEIASGKTGGEGVTAKKGTPMLTTVPSVKGMKPLCHSALFVRFCLLRREKGICLA